MNLIEPIIYGISLAMDAFAVSICKGLSVRKVNIKHSLIAGAWFGGFQALMPAIGYFLGVAFQKYIEKFDHWIALILLGAIGANMIKEALSGEEDEASCDFGVKTMFLMAVATSIDALAAGVALKCGGVELWPSVICIGVITFSLSALGVKIGNMGGAKYKSKAELLGGVILILMGIKIVLEHLGVIAF